MSPHFRTACLIGYHGKRNFGDDLFCQVLAKWVDASYAPEKLTLTGDVELLPPLDIRADCVGDVGIWHQNWLARRLSELRMIVRHPLVVFGGGSLFQRRDFFWLWFSLLSSRAINYLLGTRQAVVAIGVSVGPFHRPFSRFWFRQAIRHFDQIMLRDNSDQVNNCLVRDAVRSNDLAIVAEFSSQWVAPPTHREFRIAVTLVDRHTSQGMSHVDENKKQAILNGLLMFRRLQDVHLAVAVFAFCADPNSGDLSLSNDFSNRLEHAGIASSVVEYAGNPQATTERFLKCNVAICNRMHSHVIANILGMPNVGLAYEQKMFLFSQANAIPQETVLDVEGLCAEGVANALRVALGTNWRVVQEGVGISRRIVECHLDEVAQQLNSE